MLPSAAISDAKGNWSKTIQTTGAREATPATPTSGSPANTRSFTGEIARK